MDLHLKGKVAVVTGGASGIGEKTAEFFVQEGAKVLVSDVNGDRIEKTVKSLRERGGDAQGIRCAVIDIFYPEGKGHTIVGFETTDKGLQFIEPQFDRFVKLEVGKSYSQANAYKSQPGDDTVLRS